MLRSVTRVVIVCAGVILFAHSARAALRYRVTALALPAGTDKAEAFAMNEAGLITGMTSNSLFFGFRGVLWTTPNSPIVITGFGDDACAGVGINSAGVVVGSTGEGQAGFHWLPGGDLQTLPNFTACCGGGASGISDAGVIVGGSNLLSGANQAVTWINGRIRALPMPEGFCCTAARDVSTGGVIAGDGEGHALLWMGGQVRDLGSLGGVSISVLGVNNAGDVVGWGLLPGNDLDTRPFLWHNGTMATLPTLPGANFGYAYAINDAGLIVGTSGHSGEMDRPTLWRNGQSIDLTPHVIDLAAGMSISDARDINSAGQIIADAFIANHRRAVRLDPVPPADVVPNGIVNIDDLVALITAWGTCPPVPICAADVNDDGVVNIDDLVLVITHWTT